MFYTFFIICFKNLDMPPPMKAFQGFGGTRGSITHAVLQGVAFHLQIIPCY